MEHFKTCEEDPRPSAVGTISNANEVCKPDLKTDALKFFSQVTSRGNQDDTTPTKSNINAVMSRNQLDEDVKKSKPVAKSKGTTFTYPATLLQLGTRRVAAMEWTTQVAYRTFHLTGSRVVQRTVPQVFPGFGPGPFTGNQSQLPLSHFGLPFPPSIPFQNPFLPFVGGVNMYGPTFPLQASTLPFPGMPQSLGQSGLFGVDLRRASQVALQIPQTRETWRDKVAEACVQMEHGKIGKERAAVVRKGANREVGEVRIGYASRDEARAGATQGARQSKGKASRKINLKSRRRHQDDEQDDEDMEDEVDDDYDHDVVGTYFRPFVCNVSGCRRAYRRQCDLVIHKRNHTGERPFVCTVSGCGKAFTSNAVLKVHLRVHSGERPYACNLPGCTSSFAQRSNYIRHLRMHERHGAVWVDGELSTLTASASKRSTPPDVNGDDDDEEGDGVDGGDSEGTDDDGAENLKCEGGCDTITHPEPIVGPGSGKDTPSPDIRRDSIITGKRVKLERV